jgi:hypothetical protein
MLLHTLLPSATRALLPNARSGVRVRHCVSEYALQTPLRFGTLTLLVRLFVMNTLQCVRARARTTHHSR